MDESEDILAIIRCHNITEFNEEEVRNSDMGQWNSSNRVHSSNDEIKDVEAGHKRHDDAKRNPEPEDRIIRSPIGSINDDNDSEVIPTDNNNSTDKKRHIERSSDEVVNAGYFQRLFSNLMSFFTKADGDVRNSPDTGDVRRSDSSTEKRYDDSTAARHAYSSRSKSTVGNPHDFREALTPKKSSASRINCPQDQEKDHLPSLTYEDESKHSARTIDDRNREERETDSGRTEQEFSNELQIHADDGDFTASNDQIINITIENTHSAELQRENTRLQSELDKKTRQEIEYRETMAERHQQMEDTLNEKNAEINELHMVEERLQRKVLEVQAESQTFKVEKEDAQQRLSELMSSRLRDNNPNIVDLSDQYRPNKLGEMMNELYDNQWTNLFSYLEDNWEGDDEFPERGCTQILLTIVMETYSGCSEKVIIDTETMNNLFGLALSDMDPELFKMIKDGRKRTAFETLQNVREVCIPRLKQLALDDPIFKNADMNSAEVNDYIDECMKLCWLMVLQDPPIYLHCDGWISKQSLQADGEVKVYHTDHVSALQIVENVVEFMHVDNQAGVLEGQVQHSTLNENQTSSEKQEQDENFQRLLANDASVIPEQDINNEIGQDNTKFAIESIKSNKNTDEQQPATTTDITNEDQPFTTPNTTNKEDQRNIECNDEDAIADDVMQRVPFSKDHYREYTKRGPFIDYIVWPVMYLHKDGPILNKGVAQGCK